MLFICKICSQSSAIGLCSPQKRSPTDASSNPGEGEIATCNSAALSKQLYTAIVHVYPAANDTVKPS